MKNYARPSLAIPALLFMACSSAGDGQPESSNRASTLGGSSSLSNGSPSSSGTSAIATQLLRQNVAAAELTLAEATDIALGANPDAELLETDLDRDDGELRYEIELRLADGSVIEVHVDGVTGDILRSVAEDSDDDDDGDDGDEDDQVVCDSTISAQTATAIAEAEAGGTAVRVEADDDCEFEVVVDTGVALVEVDVSADGTVVEVDDDEVDDEGDEVEDDDEDDGDEDDGDEVEDDDDGADD